MIKIIVSSRFKKSYRNFVRKFPYLLEKIDEALLELSKNPFSDSLRTHKLSGELFGLYACKCGYDCRILFTIEKNKDNIGSSILLIDIGTHDDVY